MAALASGAIKSTTIEGGFLEVAQLLQIAEQAFVPAAGSSQPNRIQVTYNTDSKTVSITANLDLSQTVDATGHIVFAATEYC